jgi:hypothetical protein
MVTLANKSSEFRSRKSETKNNDALATHILTSGALGYGGIMLTRRSKCAYCGD